MIPSPKQRLGRGLAALIGESISEEGSAQSLSGQRQMAIDLIHSSPNNPRKQFAESDLADLTRSIAEKGLLQALVVRPRVEGGFEIVAGERRWRAAQMAGLHDLPVVIREFSDSEALEIGLIENVQRSDLNPLEEARAYVMLVEQYKYTQLQLASSIGKSRSHISNTMRLLNLPEKVRQHIDSGLLTAGHARALVATEHPEKLADQIIALGLSVRQSEALAKPQAPPPEKKPKAEKPADTRALEKTLSENLGLKVELFDKGTSGGTMTLTYKTLDQLDEICRLLVPGHNR